MLPLLSDEAPWFAFLAHPRDLSDFHEIPAAAVIRTYSASEGEFVDKMCSMPPLVAGDFTFGFQPVRGELIGVMRSADAMLSSGAAAAVVAAGCLAADRGVRVVGLGALTSPATGSGLRLLHELGSRCTITTGNAFTAAVVAANVREALAEVGTESRVALVGCTGSVGYAAARLLSDDGVDLVLIGRTAERARAILGPCVGGAVFSGELDDVQLARVVVLLTSDPSALLRREHVRAGTIVIDVAQPGNVPKSSYEDWERSGVRIREGGLVNIPAYHSSFDFRLTRPTALFACLAETYLFAREGLRDHSVGRADPELARTLERVAERHHVTVEPLFASSPCAA